MGGAGKKLQGGGARAKHRSPAAQVSDNGYGRPPHPLRLLPGQIFFPRSANGRRRLFTLVRVTGGRARCRRLDGNRERFVASTERLRAGHYIFQGYRSRRYRTWAHVVALNDAVATVVVPEWHPARPVSVSVRALPADGRQEGCWLTVTADLSAPYPARLQLAACGACQPPPAGTCPEPQWTLDSNGRGYAPAAEPPG